MTQTTNANSIQKHLPIKEIKDDVVILKNGNLRAILMTSSINFVLKSEEEKKAIIYQFQEFLNSLDFSIQILITSRKFNIGPYIQNLKEKQAKQENELLRMQTEEYINFIKSLTDISNIMTESFYLVVPYASSVIQTENFLKNLPLPFIKKDNEKQKEDKKTKNFNELKSDLWQRVEFVSTTLRSTGVKSAPLKTDELVELFYKLYNPGAQQTKGINKKEE